MVSPDKRGKQYLAKRGSTITSLLSRRRPRPRPRPRPRQRQRQRPRQRQRQRQRQSLPLFRP